MPFIKIELIKIKNTLPYLFLINKNFAFLIKIKNILECYVYFSVKHHYYYL